MTFFPQCTQSPVTKNLNQFYDVKSLNKMALKKYAIPWGLISLKKRVNKIYFIKLGIIFKREVSNTIIDKEYKGQ